MTNGQCWRKWLQNRRCPKCLTALPEPPAKEGEGLLGKDMLGYCRGFKRQFQRVKDNLAGFKGI